MHRSYLALPASNVSGLIEQARGGSLRATGELLEACRGYLLLIANEQLDDPLRAKLGGSDLVQATFVHAHRQFARFRGGSERELLAWLRKILINEIALVRREFRQTDKRDVARERPLARDGSTCNGGVHLACPRESPSRRVVAEEESQRVEQAIAGLPPQYAEIIRLRNGELLGFSEIGRRLGMGADAARKLWARAIERLQSELGAPG